jgi:hypothetical protein
MRIFGVASLATSLFVTGSFAGSALAQPLRPGYPAGTEAARSVGHNVALKIGIGAVILAGVGILVSGDSSAAATVQINSQGVIVPATSVTVSTSTSTGTQ